ncbi:hypothetical protein GGX14DRAFT_392337 [Mycena pura]|uniref:Uncharacterized protein n=1 Tax=Mycena pura TaxID=153505 RepID=A0AAD6YEG8_9AGAR|nr:hypothetical protein GGX14DRAFT_392337 [Mycena pura]
MDMPRMFYGTRVSPHVSTTVIGHRRHIPTTQKALYAPKALDPISTLIYSPQGMPGQWAAQGAAKRVPTAPKIAGTPQGMPDSGLPRMQQNDPRSPPKSRKRAVQAQKYPWILPYGHDHLAWLYPICGYVTTLAPLLGHTFKCWLEVAAIECGWKSRLKWWNGSGWESRLKWWYWFKCEVGDHETKPQSGGKIETSVDFTSMISPQETARLFGPLNRPDYNTNLRHHAILRKSIELYSPEHLEAIFHHPVKLRVKTGSISAERQMGKIYTHYAQNDCLISHETPIPDAEAQEELRAYCVGYDAYFMKKGNTYRIRNVHAKPAAQAAEQRWHDFMV